ncbi:hypothetical protein BO71DRAFT_403147 [Aspergillus ellipticus CBS 707.79]|uniref:tryptophan synthase n=1 Tax=Aspergillus ellipticus CBS 707.79 TaxID=1448320 RepID=A0A319D4B1_9EURO|nr:hypothetical protein BO71DRAFT_403147 [Aspergillus ellipticus CBS 707.79]
MEHITQTFNNCKSRNRPALIPFITAGFPTPRETPDILLSMQAGGADIIELGLPTHNPTADGPIIQHASKTAIAHGVTPRSTIGMLRTARRRGLHIPVILMGYYSSIIEYGERKIVTDCKIAGARRVFNRQFASGQGRLVPGVVSCSGNEPNSPPPTLPRPHSTRNNLHLH